MSSLQPTDFNEFFKTLNDGHEPFPWQQHLAEAVVAAQGSQQGWPQVLALPTASGKTACIDIAVFALACQADRAVEHRTAPRRIFFVVDRRIIVDEAFERAYRISCRLAQATKGVLKRVADRLRTLAAGDDPLACYQLRGGMYRDDAWARSPIQPTVIASTVDQIGSRLLYRGYGVSPFVRSIHAGLVANDSLIILDEAHCANPFRQTLEWVQRYRTWASDGLIASPCKVVLMTATPPPDINPEEVFTLSAEDLHQDRLGPRVNASKPTRLIEAKKARGKQAVRELAIELVAQARALAESGARRVAVIVNRVTVAKHAYDLLRERSEAEAILLTGRMRPLDRDAVMGGWQPYNSTADAPRGLTVWFGAGRGQPELARPVYVIATQCLEVGANLDFDAMVSECASLDALRQRFGRLDRLGTRGKAQGAIVIRADQVDDHEDPIYGSALAETWRWLQSCSEAGQIDVGIASIKSHLAACKDPELQNRLSPPAPDAPVIFPAYLDCWVQTAPEPQPDPDVAPFLHGPQNRTPDVQVCWRADLDPEQSDPDKWIEAVSLCPPAAGEFMPVPFYVVRLWMAGTEFEDGTGDVEGAQANGEGPFAPATSRCALRWFGPEASELAASSSAIRPGDNLVVPVSLGGWEVFGHVPKLNGGIAIDVGDETQLTARGIPVLRLHPAILSSWPASETHDALLRLLSEPDLPEDYGQLRELLSSLSEHHDSPSTLKQAAAALARDKKLQVLRHPFGGLVLRGSRRLQRIKGTSGTTFTDEDQTSSATVPVSLEQHSIGVERWVREYGQSLGFPKELVEDLALAARLHDVGKADPRFQCLLYGGDALAASRGPVLAKSGRLAQDARQWKLVRERSRYPRRGRHELLSVRLAEAIDGGLATVHDRDLVLHLIGSHHGRCRPFAPIVHDDSPVAVSVSLDGTAATLASSASGLERLDSGLPDRFWRLVRRYGWWGLAWLEAILRLADHRTSESEQQLAADADALVEEVQA